MSNWMGLDSGGTEQLWEPDILLDILKVFKNHEPFSRGDPSSPIFDELRALHPGITWGETRADGTFNPIFRRANPMVKLGLTTPETENASITEIGNDVLSGSLSISEVFALAASMHREQDGTASMSIMCSAALHLPGEVFSEEDVEYGVSKFSTPPGDDLSKVLEDVRRRNLRITSSSRRRRVRSFMNVLVHSGALVRSGQGWVLYDGAQAKKIAGKHSQATSSRKVQSRARASLIRTKSFQPVNIENRTRAPFDLSGAGKADPVQSALALERSSQLHEDIVANLGAEIVDLGLSVVEDPSTFDLALLAQPSALFEVKTINSQNAIAQLRKAVVQLEEYRWKHQKIFDQPPRLFIVVSQEPTSIVSEDYFDFVEKDRMMSVIWPERSFVDRHGRNLQELLVLSG